jgi:hypothetical protein
MATTEMTTNEIESAMGVIQRMLLVGAVFVAVGYVLLTVAGLQEAFDISSALSADSTKMWLKLGAVTHILVGVFVALAAIIRTLSLVPHRLGAQIE